MLAHSHFLSATPTHIYEEPVLVMYRELLHIRGTGTRVIPEVLFLTVLTPQPSTLPTIAAAIWSFVGMERKSSGSSGSLRATTWNKSALSSSEPRERNITSAPEPGSQSDTRPRIDVDKPTPVRTVVHQWSRRDVRDAAQGLSVVEPTLKTGRASVRDLEVGGPDARLRGRDPCVYPAQAWIRNHELNRLSHVADCSNTS